ncbi:hypothetical protein EJP77_07015 [Paenibacillus zeisoli]|uniref:Uncharacterized protein n=1 Tax=Paenibacillus zeisoli TaxID=2496267 RepID=A0A3S1DAE9_9BACL|nr:hypothetical protein [Paenibacillus zeisoli]RUT33392.1 hypothetical protein EJP77_07015 [Paenibacillus zeisoli]
MEYAFAALVVIGVIFLVIFNIRTSRRVREQQGRNSAGQDPMDASAFSDSAGRPADGDPARLDPTVMQINEILEPVAETGLEEGPELRAVRTRVEPVRGPAAEHAAEAHRRAATDRIAESDPRAGTDQVAELVRGASNEHVMEPNREVGTEQILEQDRREMTGQILEPNHEATAEPIAAPGRGEATEHAARPTYEPDQQHDPVLYVQPETTRAGSHSPYTVDPSTAAHKEDPGAAVDRLLASSGTTSSTTTRDEHYRQALRQLAEPERAVKPEPDHRGEDIGEDNAGDKAYREALRSILEKKSADHNERGNRNE